MHNFRTTFLMIAGIMLLASFSLGFAGESTEFDWNKFSDNLVKSLKSDNEGVRLSAMQLIIRYGDKVDVTDARYEVMDIFMKHENQKVRQLALATLYTINNGLDMGLLERQLAFEEDEVIKKHLAAVLYEADRLPAQYQLTARKVASL